MRVFVGCADCPILGSWVEVSNYKTANEFAAACEATVALFDCEEYIFPDFDGCYIHNVTDENMGCQALFDLNAAYKLAEEDHNEEAFAFYVSNLSKADYIDADTYASFQDAYCGSWDSGAEYAEELTEELGDLANVPEYIVNSIDWDRVWECNLRFDYWEERDKNGALHIFRAY